VQPGLALEKAYENALTADELLDAGAKIAYNEKLGYLTHCPTNLGTGMRASVMMFLPALTGRNQIRSLQNQLAKIGLTIRGMSGEGTAADGCLYQISNQVTLGISEEETLEKLKEVIASVSENERKLRESMKKNEPVQLGDFRITAFNVPHDSADNVGYRIEAEGIVFCLMTDAGHVTDEMKQYISEANYLVIEANHDTEMLFNGPYPDYLKERVNGLTGHLSNRACGEALVENATPRMQHVWLCHLSQENNHPELARKTVQMILQNSGIIVGKDFGLDVLKRRTPSDIFQLT
jgi:hypothetical protein